MDITQLDNLYDQLEVIQDKIDSIRAKSDTEADMEQRLGNVSNYLTNALQELEDAMMYEHYKGYNE